jgi:hypothetical protein
VFVVEKLIGKIVKRFFVVWKHLSGYMTSSHKIRRIISKAKGGIFITGIINLKIFGEWFVLL